MFAVGVVLVVGCKVGGTTIARTVRSMLPFYSAMLVALAVVTHVPAVSLWLPVVTEQIKSEEVEALEFLQPIQQPTSDT